MPCTVLPLKFHEGCPGHFSAFASILAVGKKEHQNMYSWGKNGCGGGGMGDHVKIKQYNLMI